MTQIATRLTAAADRLEDPALCNTNPWDAAVAAWLRAEARRYDYEVAEMRGKPYHLNSLGCGRLLGRDRCEHFDAAVAAADAILAVTS